jgi:hypothetical protein
MQVICVDVVIGAGLMGLLWIWSGNEWTMPRACIVEKGPSSNAMNVAAIRMVRSSIGTS